MKKFFSLTMLGSKDGTVVRALTFDPKFKGLNPAFVIIMRKYQKKV